jgi:patatin-like phospholipase/acyl hydrolase
MNYKRVLSIDGGGIKGVYPIAFLAEVEEYLSKPIHEYFDLIVGTSTGGIIALGLGLGFPAKDVLKFYTTHGPNIFSGNPYVLTFKQILWRKYGHEKLHKALEETFGNKLLGESKTRLAITSMNIDTGETIVFKTAHKPNPNNDSRKSVVEIAMATAAAPTYFPVFTDSSQMPFVDGGLWANNPVNVAVVEAVGTLGWDRNHIKVLSLGCTYSPFNVGILRKRNIGWLWARKIVETFMRGQSSGALAYAYNLFVRDKKLSSTNLLQIKYLDLILQKK